MQCLTENQRRFAELVTTIAENDQIDLSDGWRLDLEHMVWVKPEGE